MTKRLAQIRGGVLGILVVCVGGIWLAPGGQAFETSGVLAVHFFDVGQGDAIFIETPDGVQVLVDGGPDGTVLRALADTMTWSDRDLDVVIGTHPDLDHIGGLVDVLDRFEVGAVIATESTGESFAAAAYRSAIAAESASIVYARAGQVIQLGASTTLHILAPARDPSQLESNAGSVVARLVYGETAFMLTGDAPKGVEDYLVGAFGADLESDVLKLGHHGSDTSSSALFLQTVQPQYAVVSAGRDNRYGHPHPAVVERTKAVGAYMLSTQTAGTVTFFSDGAKVWMGE